MDSETLAGMLACGPLGNAQQELETEIQDLREVRDALLDAGRNYESWLLHKYIDGGHRLYYRPFADGGIVRARLLHQGRVRVVQFARDHGIKITGFVGTEVCYEADRTIVLLKDFSDDSILFKMELPFATFGEKRPY